ncbi:hypothetical protein DFJ73DRAFT_850777 [Zopfochytrium polystomum]|nr:hypothetical protein DFJ73DRAFT_850777 [Zopfochytrium polystomum]
MIGSTGRQRKFLASLSQRVISDSLPTSQRFASREHPSAFHKRAVCSKAASFQTVRILLKKCSGPSGFIEVPLCFRSLGAETFIDSRYWETVLRSRWPSFDVGALSSVDRSKMLALLEGFENGARQTKRITRRSKQDSTGNQPLGPALVDAVAKKFGAKFDKVFRDTELPRKSKRKAAETPSADNPTLKRTRTAVASAGTPNLSTATTKINAPSPPSAAPTPSTLSSPSPTPPPTEARHWASVIRGRWPHFSPAIHDASTRLRHSIFKFCEFHGVVDRETAERLRLALEAGEFDDDDEVAGPRIPVALHDVFLKVVEFRAGGELGQSCMG